MLEKNEKNMKKSPGVEYLKNEKKCNVDITRKPKTSTSANICHVLNFNFLLLPVWPEKNRQMSIKVAQKWFHKKNDRF